MLKEISLLPYWITIQRLIKTFDHVQFEHTPRAYNMHTDALATLASKIDIQGEAINVSITKRTL